MKAIWDDAHDATEIIAYELTVDEYAQLEAELAKAEQNRVDLCVMLKEWQALTHPARLSQINEETTNLLEKNKGGSDALKESNND